MNTIPFSALIEINPHVKIEKAKEYPFVEMSIVEPGRRYVCAGQNRIFQGGGAKFLPDDTLFARITPCLENGKIVQYKAIDGQVGFGSTEFFVFRARSGLSDSGFVYYLARSDLIRKPAEKSMSGASGRQRADLKSIVNLEVPYPPLPTQQKIAAILSAYDDLIENNLRRIKVLEEMAQNLYREWFVKFRYPGHQHTRFTDSPLGRIPKGWEVKDVENTFAILGGGTPSKAVPEYWHDGNVNWYSPTDLTTAGSMFMEHSINQISELGLQKSSARLFPQFSVMMTSRATLGVISINTTEACTNQGFITCVPNEHFPLYTLYYWLKENVDYFISLGTGATFREITKGVFKTVELVVPSQDIVTHFEATVQQFALQILNLQRKNAILRRTRDLLLPPLISGELDVSELDIAVPEEAGV
jgi:type I restriction enzyme, S subunit